MNCKEFTRHLDALIDGELDAATTAAAEKHLDSCAACRALHGSHLAMRGAVRANARYFAAPAKLRERFSTLGQEPVVSLAERRKAVAAPPIRPRRMAIAASIVLVAMLSAGSMHLVDRNLTAAEGLTDEIVASHIRSLQGSHLVDVPSSDQHTVKPWFNGKVDYSPPVVDLASGGFPLVGGRLDYLDHREVATEIFRRHDHVINLFVWPDAAPMTPAAMATRQGFHIRRWTAGGMIFWAVSDVNPGDLDEFERQFRAAAG